MASSAQSSPLVTVWVDKLVTGWDGDVVVPYWAPSMPLVEALRAYHDTDAHFVPSYLEREGPNGWEPSNRCPRVNIKALSALAEAKGRLRFAYGVADVDCPEAHAGGQVPADWHDTVRQRAEALVPGCAWYYTRGGLRVIWSWPRLLDPSEHTAMLRRALDHLRREGLPCDDLTDWGRCYRLPFVRRDGVDQRAPAKLVEPAPWVAPSDNNVPKVVGSETEAKTSVWDNAPRVTPRFALPEVIPAGQRHNVLKRYAASLRAKNLDEDAIRGALQAAAESYYAAHGESADAARDLENIVQWVCTFDPGPSTPSLRPSAPPPPLKVTGLQIEDKDFDCILERGDSFEVAQFVGALLDKAAGHEVVYCSGEVWTYLGATGRWVVVDKHTLYRLVGRCAGMFVKGKMSAKGVQQYTTLKLSGAACQDILRVLYELRWREGFFSNCEGVAFADCFVRVTPAGIEKHPHSPDWRCNVGYDEPYTDDDPSLWLQFLDEVWAALPADERTTQKRMAGEWIGTLLTRQTPRYQVAIMLTGGGSNGKSQFVIVVEGLLPAARVTHFTPQHLSSEYNLAKLSNSLLNCTTEVPDTEITATAAATIKALISGDAMTARNLYENGFDFTPSCGVLLAANSLPLIKDTSHGMWRRMRVFDFSRQFSGSEVVRDLGKKLLEVERVQIACWALRQLPLLLQRGEFEDTQTGLDAKQAWRVASDEVEQWIEDATIAPALVDEGTPCKDLYSSYRIWAEATGIPDSRVLTRRRFFDRLKGKMQPFFAGTAAERHLRYPLLLRTSAG